MCLLKLVTLSLLVVTLAYFGALAVADILVIDQ
jgi:hypothetical protein